MPKYVDGFVLVVPKNKTDEYKKMAEDGKKSWLKHGALQYFECRGDDLTPKPMGEEQPRSFMEITGAGNDETVWFSFIVFESKQHRDEVNAKVMAEMREQMDEFKNMQMPFDTSKMVYGGFQVEVEG